MTDLDDIAYSRADTVAAVRDFYNFLTEMYLDPSLVREPPEGGWPISELPEGFDKADEVVALLRELPYLQSYTHGGAYTVFADWPYLLGALNGDDLRALSEGPELQDCSVPPECIGLTTAGRDETTALLDTERGIIYWIYGYEGPTQNASTDPISDEPEDFAPDEECEWRSEWSASAVADFFEALKDHFRELNWIPADSETIYDIWMDQPEENEQLIAEMQATYRAHGWPDLARYRKEDCMARIHELVQAHNAALD